MNGPIDHAAEARKLLGRTVEFGVGDLAEVATDLAANVHATLALVQAQERANELKRIEVLVALLASESPEAQGALVVPVGEGTNRLRASVARSLGLGGGSDGE